ncbi:Mid1 [Carabus blaptoides fortunei]
MLPGDRAPAHPTQYAGEPTFLCLDPNIPEVFPQKKNSSHGDNDCCYTYCGTPGRPCAHCPMGAPSDTWELPPCITAPNISSNSTSDNSSTGGQCLSQCRSSMTSAASRAGSGLASAVTADCCRHWTLYNVAMCHWTVVLWTIWTLVVILEQQRQLAGLLGTLLTDLIHCSLLMCVQCARTPLALVKTKWKSRSSS